MITKQEFINNLINEALEDPTKKKELLENPKGFIERKLNLTLPENITILVHQDNATTLNIVLPSQTEELSEVELAAVSGGGCYTYESGPCGYDCPSDKKLKRNIKDL